MYDGTSFILQNEDFATTNNKGIVEMATDAEALAGTDETRYINSKQVKDNYNIVGNGTSTTISVDVPANSNQTSSTVVVPAFSYGVFNASSQNSG